MIAYDSPIALEAFGTPLWLNREQIKWRSMNMNIVGWMLFIIFTVVVLSIAFIVAHKHKNNELITIISIIIAAGLIMGAALGAKHYFPIEKEEPVVETTVEEIENHANG